jgi:hypothetical protein
LMATMIVLKLIKTAPIAGLINIPELIRGHLDPLDS